jgi:PTS system ascorbate-specific IIA component
MLKELIEKKRYSFYEGFNSWEEAVKAACAPLVADGAVLPEYVDSIISCVKEFGPYIVIAPNICIPHAQEGKGVNETAICFMKSNNPVHFSEDPEQDARLFFVLASTDNDKHMENLMALVELISDENVVEKMLKAQSIDDIKDLAQ